MLIVGIDSLTECCDRIRSRLIRDGFILTGERLEE